MAMRIQVAAKDLARALYRVQGIANQRSVNPTLAQVLLRAEGGQLTLLATDLDLSLRTTHPVRVERQGSIAVPARQLFEVVKALGPEDLTLDASENHWVMVSSGKSEFRLMGTTPDDFPKQPAVDLFGTFELATETLSNLIDQTLFCASLDETRTHLAGAHFVSPKAHTLRLVATDGHRLALSQAEIPGGVALAAPATVPRKALHEAKRLLPDAGESVRLGFSNRSFVLATAHAELSARLIDGAFPDYELAIPSTSRVHLVLDRLAFDEGLRRVALLVQARGGGIRLGIRQGQLELVAEDPDHGTARVALELEYDAEPLTVGFNPRYLLDALGALSAERVRFSLTDDLSPGVIRPVDEDGFIAVVMPMRL